MPHQPLQMPVEEQPDRTRWKWPTRGNVIKRTDGQETTRKEAKDLPRTADHERWDSMKKAPRKWTLVCSWAVRGCCWRSRGHGLPWLQHEAGAECALKSFVLFSHVNLHLYLLGVGILELQNPQKHFYTFKMLITCISIKTPYASQQCARIEHFK